MNTSKNQKEKQLIDSSRAGYESYGIRGILHSDQNESRTMCTLTESPLRHIHEKAVDNREYMFLLYDFFKKHMYIYY